MSIHPLACVSSEAQLGRDVSIGPYAVIEADVVLGDDCEVASQAVIKSGTRLGPGNAIHEGAVLGGLPQHIHKPEQPGLLIVGANNTFREHVTLHRAMHADGATVIGDGNYLMAGAHVAHDCRMGSHIIFANDAVLAGHVTVGDRAFLSQAVGVHQHCRVGSLAMIGGHARIMQDVPPFVTVDGHSGCVVGLNLVGLRRAGIKASEVADLKEAYRVLYRRAASLAERLQELKLCGTKGPASEFYQFMCGVAKRGFTQERRPPPGATIKLLPAADDSASESSPERIAKAG